MRKLLNEELDRLSVDRFRESDKTPLIIVLDNVRSLNNIGSVFRSADAYRVEKIYLCGITAQPPHKDIRKTALGATETVAWEYREHTIDVIKELNEQGVTTCAIEQAEDSITLRGFKPSTKKVAVVMGNEVKGVQQEVVDACDTVIELEQYGTKHSLNISVCTGIVIYDLFYKLNS
ncbi:RNA methyltransferase [Nonlabens ulvanivorans]|uniref:RNA methyltransferase n=2 Tax=Nonlabens TaxID=363408 RepID=A0A084JUL3_NONUL|nr:RNA methyltransferase [Nonlabens ulvanivorans]KEZ92647.1 RNA methyltransferase [Nonlabens ulvanivorans]PRX15488.1 SpoU rRNA methylase family protein [Nonlabens ulvanivorans]